MFNTLYSESSPEIKRWSQWFGFLLLVGLVLSSFAFAFWYGVSALDITGRVSETKQISVSGEGKVTARPNIAAFTAGVTTQGAKVSDAQTEANHRSSTIIGFLKGKGVEDRDITTIGYYIIPEYEYQTPPPCLRQPCPMFVQKPPAIVGYRVNTSIQVKVRDLTKTDELLDGVVTSGANEVSSLNFTLDDPELEALRSQARQRAVENSKTKASQITRDLGVRIGEIIGFSESGPGIPPVYGRLETFGKGGDNMGATAPSPQVQPGEQEIVMTVTVLYEFK